MKHLRICAGELPGAVAAPCGRKALESSLAAGAFLALLTALTFANPLQAAPIPLVALPGSPDIVTDNSGLTYDYTTGVGGTLTITALGAHVQQSVVVVNDWKSGGVPLINSSIPVVNNNTLFGSIDFNSHYDLVANFDASGAFLSGTVEVTGVMDVDVALGVQYVDRFNPTLAGSCFGVCGNNGLGVNGENLLLKGNLLGFGFAANPTLDTLHDALSVGFYMEITGGDFATAGYNFSGIRPDVGVLASGLVSYGTLDPNTTGSYGADWDPLEINDTTAFLNDFVSCTNCQLQVDTFVPVPAAVWLFGSGLLGLIGVGARNRARRTS